MERDYKTSIIQGIFFGLIVGSAVVFFLYVFGERVLDQHDAIRTGLETYAQQEQLRFQQLTNRLDSEANQRQNIINNQALILASQETLTARIIEFRTLCKR